MHRTSGFAAVVVVIAASSVVAAQSPAVQEPAATQAQEPARTQAEHQKFTLTGESALWTVAIKPDKTADFEQVMARVREALMNSDHEERHRQAAGWKLMKIDKPLPNGNVAYVHLISPVVPGADYSVMQVLYDAFPEERQALYDTYRGAFAQNLSLAAGAIVLDMTKAAPAAVVPAP
jgi:hypothetical protein